MKNKFEFELLEVPGNETISTLLKFRNEFSETGKYPFITASEEGFQAAENDPHFKVPESAEIIRKAESFDVVEWFAKERKLIGESEDEDFEDEDEFAEYMQDVDEQIKNSQASILTFEDKILGHKDILSGVPQPKTHLGIAEIKSPWMLNAFVKNGGWNACPMPEIHCAAMNYWQKKYGAEIVTLTTDIIECLVKNPPKNEEDALNLAWEQYVYCPDIVDQGTMSVSRLTETIINSDYWYFWWD